MTDEQKTGTESLGELVEGLYEEMMSSKSGGLFQTNIEQSTRDFAGLTRSYCEHKEKGCKGGAYCPGAAVMSVLAKLSEAQLAALVVAAVGLDAEERTIKERGTPTDMKSLVEFGITSMSHAAEDLRKRAADAVAKSVAVIVVEYRDTPDGKGMWHTTLECADTSVEHMSASMFDVMFDTTRHMAKLLPATLPGVSEP